MEQLQLQTLTPELAAELRRLDEKAHEAWDKVPAFIGRSKDRRREQAAREQALKDRDEYRTEIERLVLAAPFPIKDNGVHEYLETPRFVLFRNHGDPYWQAALKNGGGWKPFGEEGEDDKRGRFTTIHRDMDASALLGRVEASLSQN